MGIVVERPLLRHFLEEPGRRLLYGRRKTGKTFYARHVLAGYTYFIVRPGGSVYEPREAAEYEPRAFLRLCRLLDRVIVDEFHRARGEFFDVLQAGECPEDLVLITSTLHYHRRFTEAPGAPLKGLFASRMVGLISPVELLAQEPPAPGAESPRERVALYTLYQEPILLARSLQAVLHTAREAAKSLVGEVLEEEDRAYTRRYDAILEAIASGRERLSEIASHLHSKGLLETPSTGAVSKYLHEMTRMGLLEHIPIWGSRRRGIYRHASPLTDLAYYLDAKYGFFDYPLTPEDHLVKAAWQRLPILVERFVERLLADAHGLRPVKILEPEEIDIALVEYKRLRIVAEVKWTTRPLSRRDLDKIEARLKRYEDAEPILVVPEESLAAGETGLHILDYRGMKQLAEETYARWSSQPPANVGG